MNDSLLSNKKTSISILKKQDIINETNNNINHHLIFDDRQL